MRARLSLAAAYLRFHLGRSLLLVCIFALLFAIPLLTESFSTIAEDQLLARARSTPLVYAPPGSPLDAALGALFFRGDAGADLSMRDYDDLFETDLGLPLPILRAGTAGGYSVVGTNVDYFDFRTLAIADGRRFAVLGDAVLGAEVAARLTLSPGDRIQTDSNRIFELAGAYPVRLNVVGVLEPTGTADDYAVFVDLRTGWVAAGLGHGHQDLEGEGSDDVVLTRKDGLTIANARLEEYIEFTDYNRDRFHFHGSSDTFPLSALLVDPTDDRSAAFLQGRIADARGTDRQIFRPTGVIRDLLNDVFRIGAILNVLIAVVSGAALLAIGMVVGLSLKLRRREFEVARQIGADRLAVPKQVMAELLIILALAMAFCAGLAIASRIWGEDVFNLLFLGLLAT